MKAGGTVLDYIQALIWPVVIVGALWVFRSQLKALLANLRIKSVEAAGARIELEQVREVLEENVQESREEVAKAEDPEERERAVDKLQRDSAALGRVWTVQHYQLDALGQYSLQEYLLSLDAVAKDRGLSDLDRGQLTADFLQTLERGRGRSRSPEQVVDDWIKKGASMRPPPPRDRDENEGH